MTCAKDTLNGDIKLVFFEELYNQVSSKWANEHAQ